MTLKLLEFQDQFIIGDFFDKNNLFEKIGLQAKVFIPLGNLN